MNAPLNGGSGNSTTPQTIQNRCYSTDSDADALRAAPEGKRVYLAPAKPLVYIAGPYTHPDPVLNTREACLVADRVAEMGAAVIVPHLSLLWHAISPAPIETWYQRDLDVMRHCHAVVRLPGESTGADAEVAEAERLGLPVYTWPSDIGRLTAWVQDWRPSQTALIDGETA